MAEERAAKLAAEAAPVAVIPRGSKNGSPEERAATARLGNVINVTSRLASRAENARSQEQEFAAACNAATPAQQALVRTMIEKLVDEETRPNPPAA